MANKINFITGETYTLSELFSGDRKIIIPDLQRDYCWGDSTHTDAKIELVSNFTDNLINQFIENDSDQLNLGLIYGYEEPTNHIQLCDGQQRITTLFLLIGMINRNSGSDKLIKHLISDFEYNHNDKDPYLQYSIRESSLYFLRDLVCCFFIGGKKLADEKLADVSSISTKGNPWYFSEYNQDPSIQSMLRALRIFEIKLDSNNEKIKKLAAKDPDWLMKFGNFLVKQLTFMYYDMGSRRNGEETFVVINTTGEPLSATQNLKPLILHAEINKDGTDASVKWEEMETWFWKKRIPANGNDTADAGFEEFLRWVTIIECARKKEKDKIQTIIEQGGYVFPIETITFKSIYSYWQSVKLIFENSSYFSKNFISPELNNEKRRILNQTDCFKLLPVILYCNKWKLSVGDDRNIQRVYEFFNNLSRYQNINVDSNSVYHAIDAINSMPDCNLTSLIDCNDVSKHIRTDEELIKLSILKDKPNRSEIEDEFWKTQNFDKVNHKIWSGEISTLIDWSTESGVFDLDKFIKYRDVFDEVFVGECEGEIDITRMALLTFGLKGYPRVFSGNTNWSFGWNWGDWTSLIKENKERFKDFFDILLASENREEQQNKMITEFAGSNWWSIFLKDKSLMSFCETKKVRLVSTDGDILRLMSKTNASANDKYLYGGQDVNSKNDWEFWGIDGSNCIYTEHNKYNVAIGLCVAPDKSPEERFFLRLFKREDSNKIPFDLKAIIEEYKLKQENGHAKSNNTTSTACYELCEKLRTDISSSML